MPIKSDDSFLDHEFFSEGPNGTIKKVVRFTVVHYPGVSLYYLSFGDWNEQENKIDDSIVSNNGDAEKVLATVANILVIFTTLYPDTAVFAEGSTESRTRLYQMNINKYWSVINSLFHVFGRHSGEDFEPFQKNRNYTAKTLKAKINSWPY